MNPGTPNPLEPGHEVVEPSAIPETQERMDEDAMRAPSRGRIRRLALTAALIASGMATGVMLGRRSVAPTTVTGSDFRVDSGAIVAEANAAQLRFIDVAVATEGPALPLLPAPARVTVAESRATSIVAPLSGRVEQVAVQLGDRVKEGEKLIAIRSAVLPELGREIDTARASLAVKRAAVDRVRDLVSLQALPEKDLLLAEQEQRETEIGLRSAEGKRKSLRLGAIDPGGLYWLTASRAGMVVQRNVLVGMEAGPFQPEPLLAIASLEEVIVVADILEADAAGVRAGQKAVVATSGHDGDPIEGTVEYVGAVVDPLRRTVAVRVRVTNRGLRLRPNAFARVTFQVTGAAPRVVVPAESIVTDGQQAVVFVRTSVSGGAGARFQRRPVRLGGSRDGRTEVLDGLREGETYVTHGALLLLNALDLGS